MIPLTIMMYGIIITQLPANTLPWNTTCINNTFNFTNVTCVITQNSPWAFPLLTLMLLAMTDYIITTKTQVDAKVSLYVVALSYTILSYIEVVGRLSDASYFYVFEFIMLIIVFMIALFGARRNG